jgi:spore coat protein U-like protein
MMKSKTITVIAAFLLACSSHAQTTVSFKSNATLSSTCQIGAQDISFGEYKQNQDSFANGLINYRCTKGTQPYVSIQWNNVLP